MAFFTSSARSPSLRVVLHFRCVDFLEKVVEIKLGHEVWIAEGGLVGDGIFEIPGQKIVAKMLRFTMSSRNQRCNHCDRKSCGHCHFSAKRVRKIMKIFIIFYGSKHDICNFCLMKKQKRIICLAMFHAFFCFTLHKPLRLIYRLDKKNGIRFQLKPH